MSRWKIFGLLAFCATLTFGAYYYEVMPGCIGDAEKCFQYWTPPFAATAPSPYRYRVLATGLEDSLAPHNWLPEILVADLLIHLIAIPLVYAGLYRWLRAWVNTDRALLGCFILAAFQPMGFLRYWLSAYTMLELLLLLWFLVGLAHRWSFAVLAVLLAVAALNRETSLLLVGVYAAYEWGKPNVARRTVMLFALWAAITGGLHLALGAAPHTLGLIGTMAYNVKTILEATISGLLLLPFWLLVYTSYRKASLVLKRLVACALLYVVSVAVGASWQEVRLLLIVFPLVLPAVLMPCGSPTLAFARDDPAHEQEHHSRHDEA